MKTIIMDNTTVEAKELIEKFRGSIAESDFHVPEFISGVDMKSPKYAIVYAEEEISLAKQCALICVDEIIKELEKLHKPEYTTFIERYSEHDDNGNLTVPAITIDGYNKMEFWQSVKSSIEKH